MALFVPEIIRRKRDGGRLAADEIAAVIADYTSGAIPDYQVSALLMAVFFRGLDAAELAAWADAMLHSGDVLDFGDLSGAKVDKHSTGGVGDKISLSLAPAVAALGVRVPMISGRGLGHTGGTLDKLEAIPGFRVDQSVDRARRLLERHGLFLIGQTQELAPADRLLYALRDVTGTVESIPLIASSIMSKKLAAGIDGLVLDVKVGEGAFMADADRARELARTMIGIGRAAGKDVRALLTRMDAPLGCTVGNALEVAEAIDILKGEGPEDTTLLTVELGAEMLVLGQAAASVTEGRKAMKAVLGDGRGLAKLAAIVEAQGGDPRVLDDPSLLPTATGREIAAATRDGFVTAIHPRRVALAALEVGAGRRTKEEAVDPATGVVILVRVGDEVEEGEPLAELRHNGRGEDTALGLLAGAFDIGDDPGDAPPLVMERL